MGPGTPCNHSNYQTCAYLIPPDGIQSPVCWSGYTADNVINVGQSFGEYLESSSATADCSCSGEFGGGAPNNSVDVPNPPSINPGGIVIYSNSTTGTVTSVEPGTTGTLVMYGQYFTANGQDLSPIVQVSNGITITGYATIQPDQINANYNAVNATPGTASVTVATTGGTSAAEQIPVGDLTPVISSVSQTSFT